MRSAATVLSNQCRACPRRFVFLHGKPMHLALPFHPEWTGGRTTEAALADLQASGVTALELNLPPTLGATDSLLWHMIVRLAQPHFSLYLHAPLPPASSGWSVVHALLQVIAGGQPTPWLVVHAPPGGSGDGATVARWLATLLGTLPPSSQIALELGWDRCAGESLRARWQRWRRQSARRRGTTGRPQGVGSGLGAALSQSGVRRSSGEVLDPDLTRGWGLPWRRAGSGAGETRATTLAIVQTVGDARLGIAWDLAHDWLGGPWSGTPGWTTVPDSTFLRHVGYVRLHDVADDGSEHLPLVVGNVPYTTQLRSLLRTAFDGPVCVAVRHSHAATCWGTRAELQATSLAVARQVLRLGER